jgi:DNA polymerase-1
MRHIVFEQSDSYPTALLMKSSAFNKQELLNNYVTPLISSGVESDSVIAFTLKYDDNGKAPAKFIKEYLDSLLPELQSLGVSNLYVADSSYFKILTKQPKAEPHFGYVLPCKIKGYESMNVVLGLNYQALIFNPSLQAKLTMSLETLSTSLAGSYVPLGSSIIHSAAYPDTVTAISLALDALHEYPNLSIDIEAFSLRFNKAGIGTIALAWDQHNGIAFACDYKEVHGDEKIYGENVINYEVRALLLNFFKSYKGTVIWHNAAYDLKAIIYALWMESLLDTPGMLTGLDLMMAAAHDTKILAYLAINSTAGNVLGLKSLAHEFAGNWAKEEIKDICKIHIKDLLQYNLVDALSTWYVFNKYMPLVESENQLALYNELMMPSLKVIIQMEMTGMPMSDNRIQEAKAELERQQNEHIEAIHDNKLICALNLTLRDHAMVASNAKLKTKVHPLSAFDELVFNPNSGKQLQKLLYDQLGLPVLDYTDTKQPATGADTIEKLIHHTKDPIIKSLLAGLIGFGKVSKILSTFIPAFERGLLKTDGTRYLHGSFNLGGTVSGRLSSSDPNMQNLPSGSDFGELVKSCFVAPAGWLLVGADSNSLEDMISALTTRDKNKLKVYTDGYDGHSLRAFSYFPERLPGIVNTVESINSIKTLHKKVREDSKGPTFLLTYGGTYHGMMSNLGWPKEKAQEIEKGYHELYEDSDAYIQKRLHQASKDGYVEVAFGLRVRTPLLKQVVFGGPRMPYEAAAEGRTAGNAMGQSYGLLNNRAANAFMKKVWASKYRLDIKPVAQIHDAQYYLIRDDVEIVEWVNSNLIEAMQWQELPEIQHPTVKLGANLDIFWPSWKAHITLPNNADQTKIRELCEVAKCANSQP